MILKALYDYYQRKSKLGEIPPLGFEDKAIPFLAVIDDDGKLLALEDTTSKTEKKGRIFRLPKAEGRSGKNAYMFPNLLWDHIGFVFGYPKSDSPQGYWGCQKSVEGVCRQNREAFRNVSRKPRIFGGAQVRRKSEQTGGSPKYAGMGAMRKNRRLQHNI